MVYISLGIVGIISMFVFFIISAILDRFSKFNSSEFYFKVGTIVAFFTGIFFIIGIFFIYK